MTLSITNINEKCIPQYGIVNNVTQHNDSHNSLLKCDNGYDIQLSVIVLYCSHAECPVALVVSISDQQICETTKARTVNFYLLRSWNTNGKEATINRALDGSTYPS
jgi:hypothetical protein